MRSSLGRLYLYHKNNHNWVYYPLFIQPKAIYILLDHIPLLFNRLSHERWIKQGLFGGRGLSFTMDTIGDT